MSDNRTLYTITNKATGEARLAYLTEFGDDFVKAQIQTDAGDGEVITFQNQNKSGELTNDEYTIVEFVAETQE